MISLVVSRLMARMLCMIRYRRSLCNRLVFFVRLRIRYRLILLVVVGLGRNFVWRRLLILIGRNAVFVEDASECCGSGVTVRAVTGALVVSRSYHTTKVIDVHSSDSDAHCDVVKVVRVGGDSHGSCPIDA